MEINLNCYMTPLSIQFNFVKKKRKGRIPLNEFAILMSISLYPQITRIPQSEWSFWSGRSRISLKKSLSHPVTNVAQYPPRKTMGNKPKLFHFRRKLSNIFPFLQGTQCDGVKSSNRCESIKLNV